MCEKKEGCHCNCTPRGYDTHGRMEKKDKTRRKKQLKREVKI